MSRVVRHFGGRSARDLPGASVLLMRDVPHTANAITIGFAGLIAPDPEAKRRAVFGPLQLAIICAELLCKRQRVGARQPMRQRAASFQHNRHNNSRCRHVRRHIKLDLRTAISAALSLIIFIFLILKSRTTRAALNRVTRQPLSLFVGNVMFLQFLR